MDKHNCSVEGCQSSTETKQDLLLESTKDDALEVDPKDVILKTTARLQFLQEGIRQLYKLMFPLLDSSEVMLQSNNYHKFMARCPQANAYHYPTEERIFVFFPEGVLWGKYPGCLFVIGTDLSGNKIKLRAFESMYYYAGMHFRHPLFGTRGSRWLVGATPAKDGAVNIVFAFPLDITPMSRTRPVPNLTPEERMEFLERIIKE